MWGVIKTCPMLHVVVNSKENHQEIDDPYPLFNIAIVCLNACTLFLKLMWNLHTILKMTFIFSMIVIEVVS